MPQSQCWLHESVEMRMSMIAGRGLFAATDLPAGTVVSRLGGRLVSTSELHDLSAAGEGSSESVVVDDDVHLVLPPGTPTHVTNHSCEPNLGWVDAYTRATLRDVHAGEELTDDYATSTADPDFVMMCHCETYRCRQVIEGTDWKIPQLQKRYAGQWSPYVSRLIRDAALA